MTMGAGRGASLSHSRYDLTLFHILAVDDIKLPVMPVAGYDPVFVLYDDYIAVTAHPPGIYHRPGIGRRNG